jgi:hypothetical protein
MSSPSPNWFWPVVAGTIIVCGAALLVAQAVIGK